MVLLTLAKKIGGQVAPFLMRTGLSIRHGLLRGRDRDSPYLDMLLLIRYAQNIISLEVYDESAATVTKFKQQSKLDKIVDDVYDSMFGAPAEEEEMRKASISKIRVKVLEDYLRPALIDNEQWSDVLKWRLNFRILKWARTELLVSKYGPSVKEALDAYPQLRASPQLSRHPTSQIIRNMVRGKPIDMAKGRKTVLPSVETLMKAFRMRHWEKRKDTQSVRKAMVPIATKLGGTVLQSSNGKLLNYVDIPLEADLFDLSMEEILEVAGGHVLHCGPFNAVCEEANIYQMWTEEYVHGLGDYLLDRTSEFDGDTVVLDVGAGDGLLVHFLKEFVDTQTKQQARKMQRKPNSKTNRTNSTQKPSLIATDDGSWGIFAKAEVEKLSMEDSIAKYKVNNTDESPNQQLIVLCSWMPMGEDWSAFFRDSGVDEYILIGEADDGTCGNNWDTWGNPEFRPMSEENKSSPASSVSGELPIRDSDPTEGDIFPPYVVDGYERWDMEPLSQYQFSRFDCAVSRSSKTVSFRKFKR